MQESGNMQLAQLIVSEVVSKPNDNSKCEGTVCVQVFDSSGSFLSYINTSADPLYGPQGLALTSDGHVVVADSGNHCFKVYRYLQ